MRVRKVSLSAISLFVYLIRLWLLTQLFVNLVYEPSPEYEPSATKNYGDLKLSCSLQPKKGTIIIIVNMSILNKPAYRERLPGHVIFRTVFQASLGPMAVIDDTNLTFPLLSLPYPLQSGSFLHLFWIQVSSQIEVLIIPSRVASLHVSGFESPIPPC